MNNNHFLYRLFIVVLFTIIATSYHAENNDTSNIFTAFPIVEQNKVNGVSSAKAIINSTTYENHSPLFLNYTQKSINSFSVAYRLSNSSKTLPSAIIKLNEKDSIESITKTAYPKEDDITAVLFLIDISDPRRQKIIDKNINQIIQIIKSSKKHHKIGLASFAGNINILAPLGSRKEDIISKAKMLKATGSETLLYQHIGESIKRLNQYKASRRVLIVFSDGKAEDLKDVYNHKYVIKKALEKNIIINGMAFPPKPKKENISYYQSLERLASETGGIFVKATPEGNIDSFDLTKLLSQSDRGGYWEFNLGDLSKTNISGKTNATLAINFDRVTKEIPIQLILPMLPVLVEKEAPPPPVDKSKFYLLGVLLFLVFGVIFFFLLLKKKNKKEKKVVYGTIESLDGSEKHVIYDKTYKIGRNEENDLVLANQTISSFHAQIHLDRRKQFVITDLQSANGILINNKSIATSVLNNNDILEIGEIRFKFITGNNTSL